MGDIFYAVFLYLLFTTNILASPAQVIKQANRKALYQPTAKQFVNAGMVFNWQKNQIYQVYTKPDRISDIALEPGEKLLSIAGGDTQRWTISESQSGAGDSLIKHVFVKPHQVGLSNNMVLTTDKRVYHIELHAKSSIPYQAAVSWNYPKSALIITHKNNPVLPKKIIPKTPLEGLASRQLNFNYHFIAKKRPKWMPRRVFNDGHKTYIEFPQSMQDGEAPVLWGLSKSREPEVINYRRYKNFYIIDFVVDLAELSLGDKSPLRVGIEREQV